MPNSEPKQGVRKRRSRRRLVIGALVLIPLLYVGFFVPIATYQWDGGYTHAQYRVRVTGPGGKPIPGVTLEVEGGTLPNFYTDREGRWPVLELGRESLVTDSDGRMTFHQPGTGLQYGGSGKTYLFRGNVNAGGPFEPHVCVFQKEGYEPLRVSFRQLEEAADAQRDSAERIPDLMGMDEMPVIKIDLVMHPAGP